MTYWGWFFIVIGWATIIGLSVYCFSRVLLAKKKKEVLEISGTGRAQWASRIGLILAMAGNAIGLGNFLRFPVKAAANGGGAFMIPYFCALIFLGVPLMWVEWTIGRYGGVHGHGTTPGMFSLMWKNKAAKYIGALGISMPFVIVVYYNFIESWTLGYAWFSATGKYFGKTNMEAMNTFLKTFQGAADNATFSSMIPILIFIVIALSLNYFFLYRGLSKGIEVLAKIGMPVLFVFGVILAIRVLTMGTPDPSLPEQNVVNGLAFIWNPDFSKLTQSGVWLAAAGQIFFTLSLGQGIINTYASYLREKDDVTLNGLTTSMTNEFAEVILGGTIAIPLAVTFFGLAGTQQIASEGAFNLGFVALPTIFQKIPLGQLFGAMWFFLLFIAGITSSVAMTSPAVAFLEDEFKWKRSKAVNVVFSVMAISTFFVVAFFKFGFLDELDFWAGTLGLVLFATIEIIIFSWIFGVKKGWQEMHHGADLKIPRIFKFIIQYVTPVYMLVVLGFWIYQEAIDKFLMKGEAAVRHPYLWGARGLFLVLILLTLWMVRIAWKSKKEEKEYAEAVKEIETVK
ncbi:MAG: neurotransmitter:Na+ symporter, family [Acidobacteriota bacterium]|nr:neurotransmitter:Na+ symporter, family [Acidobacteriota bacterium]